ncbi:Mitochondrial carrier protein [Macleaya cordata]|uniref:Mitochondrial carrier protein n=1 Tax=Macleaya cordata TaxID=56857 RepID=A0A200R951_MACCD|nr:Mitochondrial carrier protein [Macleaya cordata]
MAFESEPQKKNFCVLEDVYGVMMGFIKTREVGEFVSGALAGAMTKAVLAPLETIRTRMVVGVGSKHIAGSFIEIIEQGGWQGLWAGNAVNMLRIIPTQAIELGTFECVKRAVTSAKEDWEQNGCPRIQIGHVSLDFSFSWLSPTAVGGAAAGIVSTLACHPLEVLKDRLTVNREAYPSISLALSKIYKEGGLGALYSGLSPTLIGMLPYSTCYYFMYEKLKNNYCQANNKKSLNRPEMLLIGALSGFTASTISFPLEVARKRLMVGALQGKCPPHMAAALSEVIKEEGLKGLYRGWEESPYNGSGGGLHAPLVPPSSLQHAFKEATFSGFRMFRNTKSVGPFGYDSMADIWCSWEQNRGNASIRRGLCKQSLHELRTSISKILLCLPVKSLLVFKSVSKQWLCLISDPYFVHKHALRNHRLSTPGLLLLKKLTFAENIYNQEYEFISLDGNVTVVDAPFKTLTFTNGMVDIQQSCNGLLYCHCFRMINKSNHGCKFYYGIYNPSTQHLNTLPLSPLCKHDPHAVCSVNLAFDPLKSPHYEVIFISKVPSNDDHYQIEIYSSETASWRVSGNAFPASIDTWIYPGVFWNGSLHWISTSAESSSLYFEIERESVKTMPMPPVPDGWAKRNIQYFGECRGHMHLIESYDPSTTCFDILEMVTDYTGWIVKYRVDLKELTIAYPEMVRENINVNDEFLDHFDFTVLLVEEEEEKSSKLVLQIPDKVVSYDLNTMSFKKIQELSPRSLHIEGLIRCRYHVFAYQYIESLASV